MRNYFLLTAFFIPSVFADATELTDITAPLGLNWGENASELIKDNGASQVYESGRMKVYALKNTPVKLPGFDTEVIVDDKYGLVKVLLSKDVSDDMTGFEGLHIYKEYKKILSEKYGKPVSYEYIGRKLYTESDEFYQCLRYQGCGSYVSFYSPIKGSDAGISVFLQGIKRGDGKLNIVYESMGFVKYRDEQKQAEKLDMQKGL
ncbi:hypothetical protein P4Q63_002928 [Salmonella enterica]|nr:hypothetical protein [Salmonella enterica]EJU2684369.1 hypothetical protein [Salmonella enterica]EJX3842444.1 hypothetical protein [Salmonella enterica]EJX4248513.1 hypothetical protein [Salmonella enterica]EJX4537252.1 hypothetical protein [Salmonella enterica]